MEREIVITGVGVIAPNGTGKEDFWTGLQEGRSGIRPATLFDTTYFRSKMIGECSDFNAEEFLGKKGLRNLDRATTMVSSAARLAMDDASLQVSDDNTCDIGIVTGTTFSITGDLATFTKEVVSEGPQLVNPALFPPTTMNYPSSHMAIRYKIKGFNTTLATGYTAGLDALKYAVDCIRAGRVRAVLVASVESVTFSNFIGFYKAGFLSGLRGEEICCPFDKRRNGIVLGEGATVLIVEDGDYARQRGARAYARVLGIKTFFDAYRAAGYDARARGLKNSMSEALRYSGVSEEDIDYICASANSVPAQDTIETGAIKEIFNIYSGKIPVSSIKSMLGESISAGGGLQVAAALGAMERGFIPPTINYREADASCDLDYVPEKARAGDIRKVLVNNFGPGGNSATAILSKYGDR